MPLAGVQRRQVLAAAFCKKVSVRVVQSGAFQVQWSGGGFPMRTIQPPSFLSAPRSGVAQMS
eukprot:2967475-Amphidinium_carterae.1